MIQRLAIFGATNDPESTTWAKDLVPLEEYAAGPDSSDRRDPARRQ